MPISTASAIWRVHNHAQRRHLFNLSAFTPSFPGGLEPQTYHERKVLPYTRRQLYAVVSDVESYASFVPFCTRSRVIRHLAPAPTPATPNAQQMEAELTVAFLAFTEQYTSRVTCVPYESVKAVAESATPLFKSLETTWRFHPVLATHQSNDHPTPSTPSRPQTLASEDIGPTVISLSLSFAFANPVHSAVSSAFFGRVSGLMVKAFEERCSEVYG
ncbi:dehydrase and lipid transport-domain-containing protein [Russula aff. rugulosa BPL654]|nr:dehydrase and lipid transport-domain-containing protein [Russula aff. rugulosa BPL654]